MDFKGVIFWLLVFGALYYLAPLSIFYLGILTVLCLMSSSCSSLFGSVSAVGPMTTVKVIKVDPSQDVRNISNVPSSSIKVMRIPTPTVISGIGGDTGGVGCVPIGYDKFAQYGGETWQ